MREATSGRRRQREAVAKRQIQIETGKKRHRHNDKKRMKDPTRFWSAMILDARCEVLREQAISRNIDGGGDSD